MNFIKKILSLFFFNKYFENRLEKAYDILEKKKKINEIYRLKANLQKINFKLKSEKLNKFFNEYRLDVYISLYQFIYSRFINKSFFTSRLMFAIAFNKKFYFPLPKIYLDEIAKTVPVNYLISKILFIFFIFSYFFYQILIMLRSFTFFLKTKNIDKKIIYVDSIPNLYSDTSNNSNCNDFFKWCFKQFNLKRNVTFFHCNPDIKNKEINWGVHVYKTSYIKDPIANFLNFSNIIFFFISFFKTIKICLNLILLRKIEFILLMKEFYFFYLYKYIQKKYDLCLYNNSNMVFRPMWTYLNDFFVKDSVIVYFYSTNQMPLLQELNKETYYEVYGYYLHSWDKYIAWTDYHEEWLNNFTNKKNKFIRTSFIPFAGKHIVLSQQKQNITIFDVPPKRDGIYKLLNNPYNIYTLKYCISFVDDIFKSLPNNFFQTYDIILKIKKDYSNIHPLYREYLNNLGKKKKFKIISDLSPESVIDMSVATISIPFTSTAITSLQKGKKTIFYDPSGKLTLSNSFEKKIKLLTSSKELKDWLCKLT